MIKSWGAASVCGVILLFAGYCTYASIESGHLSAHTFSDPALYHEHDYYQMPNLFWSLVTKLWNWTTNDPIAFYTAVLCLFTAILASVSIVQIRFLIRADRAAKLSADGAREEFISSHRPKLIVRNVMIDQRGPTFGPMGIFVNNILPSGQLYIENIGDTAAKFVEGFSMTYWSNKNLPMRRPYEGQNPNMVVSDKIIEPGQSAVTLFGTSSDRPLLNEVAHKIGMDGPGTFNFYVMGWIVYEDGRGIHRRTAFCRQFRPSSADYLGDGRFVAVDDPDYEHG